MNSPRNRTRRGTTAFPGVLQALISAAACRLLLLATGLGGSTSLGAEIPVISPFDLGYHGRYWNSRDGLPRDRVRWITQTADGYLWLLAGDGVYRFNGRHSVPLNVSEFGVAEGSVKRLVADSRNRLWMIASDGVHLLERNRLKSLADGDWEHARVVESDGRIVYLIVVQDRQLGLVNQ